MSCHECAADEVRMLWRGGQGGWNAWVCNECGATYSGKRLLYSQWKSVKVDYAIQAIKTMTGVDISEYVRRSE
ncbi:MAG: hypothetical protein ACXABN_16975 [Candidatus Thorarchaeota archaeon]